MRVQWVESTVVVMATVTATTTATASWRSDNGGNGGGGGDGDGDGGVDGESVEQQVGLAEFRREVWKVMYLGG